MANTKITADNLAANAVTSASISDNSIGITQLNVSDGTNGQVLTTNGSGTLSFGDIPAGYTDSDVETYLNTSAIYTDATNDRLGIGDSSPATKLEILDANGIGLRFGDVAATPSSQTAGYIGMSTSAYSGNNGDLVLIPRTSSTSNILLMEGNVGIGTNSPQTYLHVYGNNAETLRLEGNDEYTYLRWRGTVSATGTNLGYIGFAGDTGTAADLNLTNQQSGGDISIRTNGGSGTAERLRIDSSGNVGIGTTSPNGKLHVSGGRMGVISSNTHSSWGHFRIGNTVDDEISMAYVNGATESDFLGDSNPSCAYKVVTGINAYGAGSRAFAIGNDYLGNYHTMWTKEGHQLPRANNTYDLGSTTQGWRNIYTNDLNLSNLPPEGEDMEGNPYTREGNEVDGTNGSWTIQEGADDLFLINRVNGKKYKFNLTEITE